MSTTVFEYQLVDGLTGQDLTAPGGVVTVCAPGTSKKVALVDPAAGYAPLPNPFVLNRGHILFGVVNTPGSTPGSTAVDLYGMSPTGRSFRYRGTQAGAPPDILVAGGVRLETAIIPFNIGDTTAGTETDTGFDLPVNALPMGPVGVNVFVAEATRTLNAGLLSTQTNGNASGFLAGISLAAVGVTKGTLNGTPTIGALLRATNSTTQVPEAAVITTATRITYTLSAGTTAAAGCLFVPYIIVA